MIHTGKNSNPTILGVFLCAVGITAIYGGITRLRKVRKIEDTSTSPVGSAPQGTIELQGYAWPLRLLTTPLSGQPALYYELRIEEEHRDSKGNRTWKSIFKESTAQPFAFSDHSGYCTIFPQEGEFNLRKQMVYLRQLSEPQKIQLHSHLLQAKCQIDVIHRSAFQTNLRFIESCLFPGSPLYVYGYFRSPEAAQTFLPMEGINLFFQKIDGFQKSLVSDLKNFDSNHDGKISYEEWFSAYTAAASAAGRFSEIIQSQSLARSFPMASGDAIQSAAATAPTTAAGRSQADKPYDKNLGFVTNHESTRLLIADCHQQELLERLGSWNLLRVVGGAAILAVGIAILLSHFIH